MTYSIVEILREKSDSIQECKLRYSSDNYDRTLEMEKILKQVLCNKIILVDIRSIKDLQKI